MTDDVTGARKGDYLILGTLGAGEWARYIKFATRFLIASKP